MFATFPTFSTTSFKPLPTAFSSYARAEGEGQVAIPGPTHLKWRDYGGDSSRGQGSEEAYA